MTCNTLCSHHTHIASARPRNNGQNFPSGSVEFSQNPQDKVVLQPGSYTVTDLKGGETPAVDKAILDGPLQPEKGAYVFADGDPRFHASNSFSAVARTIKFFEEGTGTPVQWAFQGAADQGGGRRR